MFPTSTDRTAAAEFRTGMIMITGPAFAIEAEVGGLLLTTSAVVLAVTRTAVDMLAVVGIFVWVVALLVLVADDLSHAAHHVHRHERDRDTPRRHHQHPA